MILSPEVRWVVNHQTAELHESWVNLDMLILPLLNRVWRAAPQQEGKNMEGPNMHYRDHHKVPFSCFCWFPKPTYHHLSLQTNPQQICHKSNGSPSHWPRGWWRIPPGSTGPTSRRCEEYPARRLPSEWMGPEALAAWRRPSRSLVIEKNMDRLEISV